MSKIANFFENFFEKLGFGGKRKNNRNNTASNNMLNNMKDRHVSFGEDPGSLEGFEDDER